MQWMIADILKATAGRLLCGSAQACFAGIGIDSRTIPADFFFVAIRGGRHDGHRFIREVLAKGIRGILIADDPAEPVDHAALQASAVACVAVADTTRGLGDLARYQRSQMSIPVVAITGSNGKTTTRQMTAAVAATRFNTLATSGNLNNDIGLPLTLFALTGDHEAAVLELGMNHPGEIGRLGAICRPTIGLITNVGPAHLEFLGSLQGVAQAKAELIDHIDEQGILLLNGDDPYVADMAGRAGRRRIIYFGSGTRADVRADSVHDKERGMAFELDIAGQTIAVHLSARGRFMVTNALAAAAAGTALGIGPAGIKAGLESFRPLPGRMTITRLADGGAIIDDTYNANPASMQAAIDTLITLKGDRPGVIVVGDMLELGDQSPDLHRALGRRAAAAGVDWLLACGPHAGDVSRGAMQAGMDPSGILIGTKEQIIAELIRRPAPGAWILVKGSRGMAMESVVQALQHFLAAEH